MNILISSGLVRAPDLNSTENLRKDSKIAVHQGSESDLTELEQVCKEEWVKIAQSRCAKLIEKYPNRLKTVIKAKWFNKILTLGSDPLLISVFLACDFFF